MILTESRLGIKIPTELVEPEIRREASNYIADNYDMLIKHIISKGVSEKAYDLLNDVALSLIKAENEGRGFRVDYFSNNTITVEQFVYSRINKYCMHRRYHTNEVEHSKYTILTNEVESKPRLCIDGTVEENKDGTKVYDKRKVVKKIDIDVTTIAASPSDNSDSLSGIQLGYINAESSSSADELEAIEDKLSIESSICMVIDIASKYNVNMLGVLRNIDILGAVLARTKARREQSEAGFEAIRRIADINQAFRANLEYVLMFSMKNKDNFTSIIENIG